MKHIGSCYSFFLICLSVFFLSSCSSMHSSGDVASANTSSQTSVSVEGRLPQTIASSEKQIIVDPTVHAWGAYQSGTLVRTGMASAGAAFCPDIGRPCHTATGSFRIQSLGSADCKSTIYPKPKGGAPMPYCMFFHKNMALHGSYDVRDGNVSHGCVRLHVADAEWLRFNFANIGTKVVVKGY